ncbi:hypothetical protein EZV62_024985 [Acer yangbiense]|uniref:Uncharacterized protein n=1 Tax=Acer yangbiense TaxID=1000413 RepID=A0A5C7GWN4_9ROSI|nr:hypothetical protein EZV62_024985 [Acer yangbiense]
MVSSMEVGLRPTPVSRLTKIFTSSSFNVSSPPLSSDVWLAERGVERNDESSFACLFMLISQGIQIPWNLYFLKMAGKGFLRIPYFLNLERRRPSLEEARASLAGGGLVLHHCRRRPHPPPLSKEAKASSIMIEEDLFPHH